MKQLKVVVIGAGSASFGRGTVVDLLAARELREFDLHVWLVDVDAEALDRMLTLARMIKERHQSPAEIHATVDRREALPGADYVIVSVARRRYALWEQDYRVPLAFGFRQVYGENGGPGAAFHTLRSIHLVVPMCGDMEELCPDALLLNFTNPESRVILAVSRLTSVRAVGLCHGAFTTRRAVADTLERPVGDVEIIIGGINHFHWVLGVRSGAGEELDAAFAEALARKRDALDPTVGRMVDLFGLFPFPDAHHIGEYVSWAHETCGLFWPLGDEGKRVGGDWLNYRRRMQAERERIRRVAAGEEPLSDALATPPEEQELAVPIIRDIEFDTGARQVSVNIPNEGAIPNLPPDAIVEIPARADGEGLHGETVGALPEAVAAMCRTQIAIQDLLVSAYEEGSKRHLLQALVLDPVVDSAERAERMMNVLLEAEADFLPELK